MKKSQNHFKLKCFFTVWQECSISLGWNHFQAIILITDIFLIVRVEKSIKINVFETIVFPRAGDKLHKLFTINLIARRSLLKKRGLQHLQSVPKSIQLDDFIHF